MYMQLSKNCSKDMFLRVLNFIVPSHIEDYDFINNELFYLEIDRISGKRIYEKYIDSDISYSEFVDRYGFNDKLEIVILLYFLGITDWYFNVVSKGFFRTNDNKNDCRKIYSGLRM